MHPERWNLKLVPLDFYSLVYPFPPEAIANIAYEFTDENLEAEYLQALVHWIDPVQEKVRAWQHAWDEENSAPQPHLYMYTKNGETWIYDSRFGDVRDYPITPAVKHLLLSLEDTRRLSSLCNSIEPCEGLDLERDLAWVQERGLLFEEDGKALSLVLHSKPPEMTYRASALGVRKKLRPAAELAPATGPIAPIGRSARRTVKPGVRA